MFEIQEVLPTRIGVSHLGRPITEAELNAATSLERDLNDPKLSNARYVLNDSTLDSIREFIAKSCKSYIDSVYAPCTELSFYITNSWFTYLTNNQSLPHHTHANCLFSGTFYLDCERGDCITFHNSRYYQISIESNHPHVLDQYYKDVKISPGQLVLFPAYLHHSVPPMIRTRERISMAFNVFARGYIGSEHKYSALHI